MVGAIAPDTMMGYAGTDLLRDGQRADAAEVRNKIIRDDEIGLTAVEGGLEFLARARDFDFVANVALAQFVTEQFGVMVAIFQHDDPISEGWHLCSVAGLRTSARRMNMRHLGGLAGRFQLVNPFAESSICTRKPPDAKPEASRAHRKRSNRSGRSGKGVKFIRPPKDEEYGTVAVFEDLYGNKWDLLELNR